MMKRDVDHAHILLSHTHWDHINGFPFFEPAFTAGKTFEIMAGHCDAATAGRENAGDRAQRCCFPGTVVTDQAQDFTRSNTQ